MWYKADISKLGGGGGCGDLLRLGKVNSWALVVVAKWGCSLLDMVPLGFVHARHELYQQDTHSSKMRVLKQRTEGILRVQTVCWCFLPVSYGFWKFPITEKQEFGTGNS